MAVTTTVQEILDAAFAKSTKNQPGTIATSGVELLQVVIRSLRGLYAFAARVNPLQFSTVAVVAEVTGFWARPEAAQSIFRVEGPGGSEVAVVPFDDRQAEPSVPSIYEFQSGFNAVTNASGTTSGFLTFWFSQRPDDPTPLDLTGILDPDWVEDFNELLILEVALYLSLKDGRMEEVAGFKQNRNDWARLFANYLQHATANLRRRFGHQRIIDVETLLPMLTGGA
jgi:hypothetical protein